MNPEKNSKQTERYVKVRKYILVRNNIKKKIKILFKHFICCSLFEKGIK